MDVKQQTLVAVALVVLLVGPHDRRFGPKIRRRRKGPEGLHGGEGLQAVFGHEPRCDIEIVLNRSTTPYAPVVAVTVVVLIRWAVIIRRWSPRPVRRLSRIFRHGAT